MAEIDLLLEARDRLSVLVNDVKHSDSYPIEDILARLELAAAGFCESGGPSRGAEIELPQHSSQFFAVFDFNQEIQ